MTENDFQELMKATPEDFQELMEAVTSNDPAHLSAFLATGVHVNAANQHGWTPLHEAAFRGHAAIMDPLLQKGAKVGLQDRNGDTPLHHAALGTSEGHQQAVALLCEAQADLNAQNQRGETALDVAASWGREHTVPLLLGTNPTLHNKHQENPLHRGVCSRNTEVISLLLPWAQDINAQDERGWTPLHHAVWTRGEHHMQNIQKLLDAGADVTAQNNEGETPLHTAAVLGDESLVRLLLKSGAEPQQVNHKHQTPFDRLPYWAADTLKELLRPPLACQCPVHETTPVRP